MPDLFEVLCQDGRHLLRWCKSLRHSWRQLRQQLRHLAVSILGDPLPLHDHPPKRKSCCSPRRQGCLGWRHTCWPPLPGGSKDDCDGTDVISRCWAVGAETVSCSSELWTEMTQRRLLTLSSWEILDQRKKYFHSVRFISNLTRLDKSRRCISS